jgi:hypothetical protein
MMFSLIVTILKLVSLGAKWLNERGHFKAGQQDQLVRSLEEVAKSAGVAKKIRRETEEMSDDQLDQELIS